MPIEAFLSDDSDDDLMVPLSQRLARKGAVMNVAARETQTSQDASETLEKNALRRSHTMVEGSPAVVKRKQKKENSPIKLSSESSSISSIDQLLPQTGNLSLDEITEISKDNEPIASESQASTSQQSYQSSSQLGRAPAKPISSRDCYALISHDMLTKYFSDLEIKKIFSEYEVRHKYTTDALTPFSVTWVRESTNQETGSPAEREEDNVAVIVSMEDVVRMVHVYMLNKAASQSSKNKMEFKESPVARNSSTEVVDLASDSDSDSVQSVEETANDDEDLVAYVEKIRKLYPGKNIILIFFALNSYFQSLKNKEVHKFREYMAALDGKKIRKRKSLGLPIISKSDLTEAIIDLDFRAPLSSAFSIRVLRCERNVDVMTTIASLTRSIAEAPSKQRLQKLHSMSWFADNDNKNSVDIKDVQKDAPRLWRKQLEQFPKISRDVAESIACKYPSIHSLIHSYDNLTKEEARLLLQDIQIGKHNGLQKRTRRLGPELSSQLFVFFTSRNPDKFIKSEGQQTLASHLQK